MTTSGIEIVSLAILLLSITLTSASVQSSWSSPDILGYHYCVIARPAEMGSKKTFVFVMYHFSIPGILEE